MEQVTNNGLMQVKDGFSVDFKTHKSKVASNKVYRKRGASFFVAMIFYEAYLQDSKWSRNYRTVSIFPLGIGGILLVQASNIHPQFTSTNKEERCSFLLSQIDCMAGSDCKERDREKQFR